jgi:hypothetical protein
MLVDILVEELHMFTDNNCVVVVELAKPSIWSSEACPTFDGLIRIWSLCPVSSHWECPFGCPFDGFLRFKVVSFTEAGPRVAEAPAGVFCLPTLPQ